MSIAITLPNVVSGDGAWCYSIQVTLECPEGFFSVRDYLSGFTLNFTSPPDEANRISFSYEGISFEGAITLALDIQKQFKDRSRDTGSATPNISGTIEIVKSP